MCLRSRSMPWLTLEFALTTVFLTFLAVHAPVLAGAADVAGAADAAEAHPMPMRHVVLVSIDGLRPEFYLDPTWPAPMMQQMVAEGAHAEAVRGVFPSVTYPSHTTLVTGARPARHGIYYNSPFEPEGATGAWYWYADAIRVDTLWQAVHRAGGTSAAVSWPVSAGAEIDYNLPEIWSLDPTAAPLAAMRDATRPSGLWQELEREAAGPLNGETFHIDFLTRDDRAGDIAAYLLAKKRPSLLAVHLIETDHWQHERGREDWLVRRAVAAVDRALAQMVEAAEREGILEQTTFVVTGDHGHVDLHTLLAPNVWLTAAGLLEQPGEGERGRWRATFHTSAASAFLMLRDPADREAVTAARTALEALPAGLRRLFRIVDREELDRLGASPEAAFALNPAPGVHFTSSAEAPAVRPSQGATHGYVPDFPQIHTGLVLWGAAVREGAVAQELHLEDIAPIVAALLGLDDFEAPDGVLPAGLLTAAQE